MDPIGDFEKILKRKQTHGKRRHHATCKGNMDIKIEEVSEFIKKK